MVIGWQSDGTNKYYMDTVSGVMAVGWKQIDKRWYYFNQAGHMITGWLNDGGRSVSYTHLYPSRCRADWGLSPFETCARWAHHKGDRVQNVPASYLQSDF